MPRQILGTLLQGRLLQVHNRTVRLSVQLYTLRDSLEEDLTGTLRSLREMGFEYVELAGYYGRTAPDFASILSDEGLKVSAGHWGLDQIRNVDQTCREAECFGCMHVVLPWVPESVYAKGWVEFGQGLEQLAHTYAERGRTLSYHNHAFEFEPNAASTFSQMWDRTTETLKAQLDIGWLAYAGEDSVAWIDRLGSRAHLVHLKDFSGNRDRHDAEAGTGTIDWHPVLEACKRNEVLFGSIEMDRTPNEPKLSVRRCFDYFSSLGLS
jgi:sugar phosphate isomerase/epimerase